LALASWVREVGGSGDLLLAAPERGVSLVQSLPRRLPFLKQRRTSDTSFPGMEDLGAFSWRTAPLGPCRAHPGGTPNSCACKGHVKAHNKSCAKCSALPQCFISLLARLYFATETRPTDWSGIACHLAGECRFDCLLERRLARDARFAPLRLGHSSLESCDAVSRLNALVSTA
jgi:hypothetical protein